jgi:S-methylmethionine-dependent homocysteine/selenocysteine methylase
MENNQLTDGQILEAVLKEIKETSNSLATKLNLSSPSSFYHILNGKNKLSESMKDRIILEFPQVSREFMDTGTGEVVLVGSKLQNQKNFFNIGDKQNDFAKFAQVPDLLMELIDLQKETSKKQDLTNELLDKVHTELLNKRA